VLQELAHGLESETVVLEASDRPVLLNDRYTARQKVFAILTGLAVAMMALAGLYLAGIATSRVGLILILSSLALYAFWVNHQRRYLAEMISLDEVIPLLVPVDIEILSRVLDVSQASHVRDSQEFHKLQQRQVCLAVDNLRRMKHNAVLLQRVGYSQLHSSNPLVAEQAQELIDFAVHVRLYTSMGVVALFFHRIFKLYPAHRLMFSGLIRRYETLKSSAKNFPVLNNTTLREVLAQNL
jgi:hypothetical protein